MIFYSDKNVYQAAKGRIHRIFDEYENKCPIVVSCSFGKDSTVILNIVKEVMDERCIKKIPLFWLDQELEAPMVVEHARKIYSLPWVEQVWVQSEFPRFNAHNGTNDMVFGKDKEWLREKEPNNPYTDFDLTDYKKYASEYNFFLHKIFGEYVTIGGLHIDESPMRRLALLRNLGNCPFKQDKGGKIFYPIFDFTVYDIWYYIFSNRISYCKLYNYMFSQMKLTACRVGSFWNPQCQPMLKIIKEIDPKFYDKLQKRIKGINSSLHSFSELSDYVSSLPPYFSSWEEYVSYLIENIGVEGYKKQMYNTYKATLNRRLKEIKGNRELEELVNKKIGISAARCVIKEDKDMRELVQESYRTYITIKERETI